MENKTRVYSDGNTEAGCEKVLMDEEANVIWSAYHEAHFVHQPANSQPTLPLTFYSATTVHDNKCMPVSNGLAGQKRTKGIYKYIQWTYIQERGNRSSQKRDLVTDDST